MRKDFGRQRFPTETAARPLTVVVGYLETMLDSDESCQSGAGKRASASDAATGRAHASLLNDLLMLARLEPADEGKPRKK